MTPVEAAGYLKISPQAVALYRSYYLEAKAMSLYFRENKYQGVNAHLTSLQQIPDSIGR